MIQALLLLPHSLFSRFLARKQAASPCFSALMSRRKAFRLLSCIIGLSTILVLSTFITSQAEFLLEADKEGQLHASLRNITLEEVGSFFHKNYDIKIVGDSDQLQTEVTIVFESLSVEKALKKIFSRMNIVLMYDSRGTITEVRVLPAGRRTSNPVLVNNPVIGSARPLALIEDEPDVADVQSVDESDLPYAAPESAIDDDTAELDQGDLSTDDSFQVVPNTPPSGDDFEIVPGNPPSGN